jgi:Amt family ammonium transporter
VHGVGGLIGTLLAAVFASPIFGGKLADLSIGAQFGTQLMACAITIVYTGAVSFGLLKLVDGTIGLRVDADSETRGLDLSLHEEAGYNYQG